MLATPRRPRPSKGRRRAMTARRARIPRRGALFKEGDWSFLEMGLEGNDVPVNDPNPMPPVQGRSQRGSGNGNQVVVKSQSLPSSVPDGNGNGIVTPLSYTCELAINEQKKSVKCKIRNVPIPKKPGRKMKASKVDGGGTGTEVNEGKTPNHDHSGPSHVGVHQAPKKLILTPAILRKVEGRSIFKRLAGAGPVASGSQKMRPNPETYFLAQDRIKYKPVTKAKEQVMNDAMKGKGPRGKGGKLVKPKPGESLPQKPNSNFSVTAAAMKAQVDSSNFTQGNMHDEEVKKLLDKIKDIQFPNWLGLFRDGFNVMLHGYGSKLEVLKEFQNFVNDEYLVVTINGLFPKLNPRKLVLGLYEKILPGKRAPTGFAAETLTREVVTILRQEEHADIFIIINNFDKMALTMPQMLSVICLLAPVPYIKILAACDTVNAFLGVSQSQALQLRFCWSHCPTFKPFQEELQWTPGIFGEETKSATQKARFGLVLQALTWNSKRAFALLAQLQLNQMKSQIAKRTKGLFQGVPFLELAQQCREKFIAHTDQNLRALLGEFIEHQLIKQVMKGNQFENKLLIQLDVNTLEEAISEFGLDKM